MVLVLAPSGFGSVQEAQAGINFEINEDREVIKVNLTTMGNADYVVLKNVDGMKIGGSMEETVGRDGMIYLQGVTSEPVRLSPNSSSGEINAVAVIGEPTEKFAVGGPKDEVAMVVKEETQNCGLWSIIHRGEDEVRTVIQNKEYDFG